MAVVSVNLSKAAGREWERIPRGKRSRVVSNYLVSRSLDAVDPTEGVSGHELAEMVSELRQTIKEGRKHREALRTRVRVLETEEYTSLTDGEIARVRRLADEAKAEVAARLKVMGEEE